jgi:hypothetical protein
MNLTKDPVLFTHFGGAQRPIRWDYNTLAELQPLGYDFTDEAFVERLVGKRDASGKVIREPQKPTLKMLAAFAAAALTSGAAPGETPAAYEDGREFTPREVGRTVTRDADKSDLFAKVSELMQLAHGEAEPESPLAEVVAIA